MVTVKRNTFKFLEWLFEGDTFLPAVAVFLYTLLWFVPVFLPASELDVEYHRLWDLIGWQPNGIWAVAFIGVAGYQVLCCRLVRCIRWMRITTAFLISAFVTYVAIAPAIEYWYRTGKLLDTVAGASVMVFLCILLVARNLHREGNNGGRGT